MQAQQEKKTVEREEKVAATKLQALAKMMAAKKEARRLKEEQQRAGGSPTQTSSQAPADIDALAEKAKATGVTARKVEDLAQSPAHYYAAKGVTRALEKLSSKPEQATTGPLSPPSTPKARGQTREAPKGRGG